VTFDSVYRVSTRLSLPAAAEVDALAQELGMELPLGYREFVTTFGRGELCEVLHVYMPSEIRTSSGSNDSERERAWLAYKTSERETLARLADDYRDRDIDSPLTPDDLEEAVVFASMERPMYAAARRCGQRLFEIVDGDVWEIGDGLHGLVELCTSRQQQDFPFFEPANGRRKMRGFFVRSSIGPEGFIDALVRRWGVRDIRRSRTAVDETNPHFFVPAIEGHLDLLLNQTTGLPRGLPRGCFFARVKYDIDSEADVAAFAEPLLLPGGTSWGYNGMA